MSPIPHHTAASSKGEPNDFAIAAGVKKMPSAIDCPITRAMFPADPIACADPLRTTSYRRGYVSSIDQKVEVLLGRRARLFRAFHFDQLAGGHVVHITV